jgi:AcrR family transcriptional regulator
MRRFGTTGSPRVADIVSEAGVSTDVFYRHFRSKDELVTAVLEEGTIRLRDHLARRMAQVDDPADQVRRWVAGILATVSRPDLSDTLRAVLWNGARVSDDSSRRVVARETLARPLHEPLQRLGSTDPERDARLVGHTTLGRLEDFLWSRQAPTPDDVEHTASFCLRCVGVAPPASTASTRTQPRPARPDHAGADSRRQKGDR